MTAFRRKAAVLSAVAGFLALLVAAGVVFSPGARNARASRIRLLVPDPAEIHAVEVSGPDGSLVFRRFGAAWTLEEDGLPLPARTERIEAYLETLHSVRSLVEVSRREASWDELGLDEGSSRRIRLLLRDGASAADFRAGRYAPDGSRVFLRKSGETRAYAAPAATASRLPAGRKAWLDLRVFGEPVPREDVQRLRVSGSVRFPDGTVRRAEYILERGLSGAWTSPQIPDLDTAAAGRLVRSWMGAEAEDFSLRRPEDREGLRVDLELGGGSLRSLRISGTPDPEGGYTAALTGSGQYLILDARILRDLLMTPGELSAGGL